MIDRELINYPEQFAAKLNMMDRDIDVLKRGGGGGRQRPVTSGTPGPQGDPGASLPSGGTAGQTLLKNSSVDYDYSWATPPAAPVTSVAGKVGVVTLNGADVGLSNVTNDAQVALAGDQTIAGDKTFTGMTTVGGLYASAGSTANLQKTRLVDTGDAGLSSINHPLQIGDTSGHNIAVDSNEIMARNNGAASTLYINNDGGIVDMQNADKVNLPSYSIMRSTTATLSTSGLPLNTYVYTKINGLSALERSLMIISLTNGGGGQTEAVIVAHGSPFANREIYGTKMGASKDAGYQLGIGGINGTGIYLMFKTAGFASNTWVTFAWVGESSSEVTFGTPTTTMPSGLTLW